MHGVLGQAVDRALPKQLVVEFAVGCVVENGGDHLAPPMTIPMTRATTMGKGSLV